ncbi:FtsQ-type POTRA domain-containing protein [Brevibacillus sp. SYP-B805]|uniref:cell division protein FtsQ/DivIB n=1 Tax=Brevibacillus sp. SYP-B805 TaxID=1578199 RepID=UPI0013ECE72B|nr:FtsQ-type POTRA domain-containing protein [Brevibacillus sp. SYP-B805]NGQ93721.1 FtsQ-type POTRA domain-containing protein [Brevibacillus sp. SYP-B805]
MAVYQERIPQVKQTKPKRKSNRRLLFLLLLFFLTVLAVVFFRSPYSKVQEIRVFGRDLYSEQEILQASGLAIGMQFLNVWESSVQESMKVLKGVKSVTIVRHFPGVIELHVVEYKRVALWATPDGKLSPLLENGVVLDQADFRKRVVDRPLIRSWGSPELLPQLAKALAQLPPSVAGEISDISLTPTSYDKQRITLYMRDGNEVHSVIYQLAKKLVWYPAIVKDLPEGEKGVIYMLESTWFQKYGTPEQPAADKEKLPEEPQTQKETVSNGQS